MWRVPVLVVVGLTSWAAAEVSDEPAAPVRIEAAGKPIDTEVGHAAPFVCDSDGDGVQDLLVGRFGDGRLRIYRNEGTSVQPKLAAGVQLVTPGDGRGGAQLPPEYETHGWVWLFLRK